MAKQSNGEKREAQLKYRYKQLKRIGKIPKDMPLKEFRESEYNEYVPVLKRIKGTKPVEKIKVERLISHKSAIEKSQQRRLIRHLMLIETQVAKKKKKIKGAERKRIQIEKQFVPCIAA